MEEIKAPKKERKFLRAIGDIALTLARELVLGIGKKLINKVGNKRQGLVIAAILFASVTAIAQYPGTGNKMRLGFQTTGDGLVYRGRAADTLSIKSSGLNNAYFILDTVNNIVYNYIKTKGGWQFTNGDTIIINNNFTQPVDSLFFNVNVPTNNVDTAKMRWDADLATVVLGLNDNVPNELGFKSFWLVKNQTGATITKGSIVYANGTVGVSGRITVAKFIANGTIDAKYLLGITAHDLSNGEDGYVISFGKVRQVNTDTFSPGAILYPSPTVAGVWTDVEPVAPNIDMPIGFCINSHANNGTIAIRVASGYKLHELHDVAITSPVDKASLYYRNGIWRDTTVALLTSDTAAMLANYLKTGVADSKYLPLTGGTVSGTINRQEGSNDGNTSTFYYNILNYFAKRDNNKGLQTAQITFTDRPGTSTFPNNVRTSDIYLMTAKNFSGGQLGQYIDTTLSIVANQDGGRVGISKLNPAYKLDVNGTLGVTGATTLSNLASASTTIVTSSSTGLLSGVTTLPIANGGTNATTISQARTNLGATVRGANVFTLPDISALSFLRYNADNTVSQRGADGMRSDLGGTTIGQSMFTLTNPSAITFPRFNADNTVTARSATDFRTDIGAGTGNGNGTVTSVSAATTPNGLSVATGTTTPVISMALAASGITGVVSNGTQTFSGSKTFANDLATSGAFSASGFSTLTGGASVGSLATTSSLTRVIGVNSSNAIGELTLSGGLSVSAGNLSIQAATASQTGTVISFGSQTFGGNKTFNANLTTNGNMQVDGSLNVSSTSTFGGRVIMTALERSYINSTSTTVNVNINVTWVNIHQDAAVTITLPSAATYPGKELIIKQTGTGIVSSSSTNIIGFTTNYFLGSPQTVIINPSTWKFVTLVSDGTYWITMQRNN